jgi:hypothetical protein
MILRGARSDFIFGGDFAAFIDQNIDGLRCSYDYIMGRIGILIGYINTQFQSSLKALDYNLDI